MVATIKRLPDGFYEPNQLKNLEVMIDNKRYLVTGVERFAISYCTPEHPYTFSFGLLVKES